MSHCQPYADYLALRPFSVVDVCPVGLSLAICFRLPLTTTTAGLFTLHFITAPSSLFQRQTDGQMILWQYITQTDYRVIAIYKTAPCGTFSQLPWMRCEVTATERDTSCRDRSVSRQSLRVASRADCYSVMFILQIPLSPTSLLTDVRGGVAMRKSVKHLFFL